MSNIINPIIIKKGAEVIGHEVIEGYAKMYFVAEGGVYDPNLEITISPQQAEDIELPLKKVAEGGEV